MSAPQTLLSPALDVPLLWVVVSYLLGAIPFAVWVGRRAGQDPRRRGSKNPGASNVARTAGVRWGVITLILDALKGAVIPICIARGLLLSQPDLLEIARDPMWALNLTEWSAICGVAAVLGHVTSPFLGFRGGRGVATALGATAALNLNIAALSACAWIVTLIITRVPAWSSLVLCASLIFLSNAQGVPDSVHLFSICVAAIIAVRHWPHLKRLFNGSSSSARIDYLALYPSLSSRRGRNKDGKSKARRSKAKSRSQSRKKSRGRAR